MTEPVRREAFMEEFFWMACTPRDWLPLRAFKDFLFVSPEAFPVVPDDLRAGTKVDPRLRDLEMRLERACR